MNLSQPLIHCSNSDCSNPLNPVGGKFCSSCQKPLVYRYLWAVGTAAAQIRVGELVEARYKVIKPQIWLDTRPDLAANVPEQISSDIVPYLKLSPQQLHVPGVYGVCRPNNSSTEIVLLENIPIDGAGNFYPSIGEAWVQASPVRQVYWLWQILQLWTPLAELNAISSLFSLENIRVEGWRVRLRQLDADAIADTDIEIPHTKNGNGVSAGLEAWTQGNGNSHATVHTTSQALINPPIKPSLQQLGEIWASWFKEADAKIAIPLQEIFQQMQLGETPFNAIANRLNQLLLEQAAQQYLRMRVVGATDTGRQSEHNEDCCYPIGSDLSPDLIVNKDPLITHLALVCDGIGGHEGGEVASQLAVQSIKLQVQALLTEVAEQEELMPPDLVTEQLEAIIRIANNLIGARNDEQGRESRRRMATTLVMALQLPQKIQLAENIGNSHELYIAHVGDTRAYWITDKTCQQITVDDDVANREVRLGRSLYHEALQRSDAGALTQALGIRDSELLRPTVQRLIIEEDGLLLLCSDGLSDNNLVEEYWQDFAEPVLRGQMSLESAVEFLIHLANEQNGHDNTSVVLTYCRVSAEHPVVLNLDNLGANSVVSTPQVPQINIPPVEPVEEAVSEEEPVAQETTQPRPKVWLMVIWVLILLMTGGVVGLFAWSLIAPTGFQQLRDRILPNPTSAPTPEANTSPDSTLLPTPEVSTSPDSTLSPTPEASTSPDSIPSPTPEASTSPDSTPSPTPEASTPASTQ